MTGKRTGLSGKDMNRKFHPSEESEENQDPDDKIVGLAKSLMDRADIILNLTRVTAFTLRSGSTRPGTPSDGGNATLSMSLPSTCPMGGDYIWSREDR